MVFYPQGFGSAGSSGSITVADSHVFADTTARDAYFASHASELVDQLYIYITAGTLLQQYDLDTTSWIDRTPVVRGPTGLSGDDGKTWLNGSGAPSNSIGVDGDFYLDTTNNTLYGPKATTWPAGISLIINYTAGDGIDITGTAISVDFIDESGKVLTAALPSSITGAVSYHGSFDPASGAPIPSDTGYYYVSSGVGTIGSISFATGDWLVYRDASSWDKIGNSSANVSWANVSDKPSTFTPATHTQAISTITNLQSALDGKLGTTDTAANSTLWASLAMPNITNAAALQVMRLNADKSALEFATVTGGSGDATWGSIEGTLSSQTDLQEELDKRPTFYESATEPTEAVEGDLWIDTSDNSVPYAQIDTDATFAANSDSKVPSQKAVKTAVEIRNPRFGQVFRLTGNYSYEGVVRDWGANGAYDGPASLGSSDGDYSICSVYKTASESIINIGVRKSSLYGIFDIYINDVLDSSGYDLYASSGSDAMLIVSTTISLISGWNTLKFKINGKNESATRYGIGIYGVRLR